MTRPDPFVGTWELDPAQSRYEVGQPPRQATYRIEPDGAGLAITIDWVAADGRAAHVAYHGIPDGQDYPYENLQVAETMSMTRVIASATRELTPTNEQGQSHRIVQVYEKRSS